MNFAVKDKSYYSGMRQDVFALVPPNIHRVLEIGCGSGRFRENFRWAKILLVLLAPVICCLGWDVCRTQMLFRARKGKAMSDGS